MKRILTLTSALAIAAGAIAQDKPLIAGFDGTAAP